MKVQIYESYKLHGIYKIHNENLPMQNAIAGRTNNIPSVVFVQVIHILEANEK